MFERKVLFLIPSVISQLCILIRVSWNIDLRSSDGLDDPIGWVGNKVKFRSASIWNVSEINDHSEPELMTETEK